MSDYFDPSSYRDGFFVPCFSWLLEIPGVQGRDLVTYGLLYTYWRKHQVCNPSISRLARDLRVHDRTAMRLVARLVKLDLILALKSHGKVTEYVFVSPKSGDNPVSGDNFVTSDRSVAQPVTKLVKSGDNPVTQLKRVNSLVNNSPDFKKIGSSGAGDSSDREEQDGQAPRKPIGEEIAELEDRYQSGLTAAARDACALSRRSGKLADSVWLRTLRQMATYPVGVATYAMRRMIDRYGDGERDERYMIGIARRYRAGNGRNQGSEPAKSNHEWNANDQDDDFVDLMNGSFDR